MKRPDCIKNYSEIQENPSESHYPLSRELHSVGSPFGRAFGLLKLDVHHELLKPGQRTSYPHAEQDEEEFVYVIEGRPHLWLHGHMHELSPGDGVGLPSGTGICHTFINNTSSDVRLLVVGEKSKPESKIYYPLHPHRRTQCREVWWHEDVCDLQREALCHIEVQGLIME